MRHRAEEQGARDEKAAAAAGLEMQIPFGPEGFAALRLGYLFDQVAGGFSLGVGVKEGRFLFDYALGVKKEVSQVHHISLGIRL